MAETEKDIISEILGFDPETGKRAFQATGDKREKLFYISEDGQPAPRYKSFEALTAPGSPWRKYIADPVIISSDLLIEGKKKSRRIRKLAKRIRRTRESNKEYISISDEMIVVAHLSHRPLDPEIDILIIANAFPSNISLKLGEIVGAFEPDPPDLLKIANNSPWGKEGGFQVLANITDKPIMVTVPPSNSMEYLPRP